jgi:hypothetical protein
MVALALAGFVAGHFAGRWQVGNAVLAAGGYIMIAATAIGLNEASQASITGLSALPPLDFVQLAVGAVFGLTAASIGGWLAGRGQPRPDAPDRG